jgi:hypothetical protein
MQVPKTAAALFAAAGAAAWIAVAPIAHADTCDPVATICEGDVQTDTSPPSAAPSVSASDDEYPYEGDWYFNPAGGGTELQPEHPSTGGGSAGDGGHH